MRLAISNIAWDISEDESIARLLQQNHFDAIDIAPGKYFPIPEQAENGQIKEIKTWWNHRGIEITGMQALLFGTQGLNIFGGKSSQKKIHEHLKNICLIAEKLGATRLVFGSPKNRDRQNFTDTETLDIAISFFQRLGDVAQNHGVYFCLEPNPTCYGANFMTTGYETANVVQHVGHPAIKMQLDTGAITINNEDIIALLNKHVHLIGHVHLSEPNLLPLGDSKTDHTQLATTINKFLPHHILTIEMIATQNEDHLSSIERALCTVTQYYRINSIGKLL